MIKLKKGRVISFPRNIKIENPVNSLNVVAKDAEEVLDVRENHDEYRSIVDAVNKPLNIIHGNTQLLELLIEKENITNNYQLDRCMDSIKQNCYKLTKMINNIIEIQKIVTKKFSLCYNVVNIVEMVENTVLNVPKVIKDKRIIFDTNLEEKFILCDVEKIQKSILILLGTAVKFSNDEDIIVKLKGKDSYINIIISFKNKDSKDLNYIINKMDNLSTECHDDISIGFHICKAIIGFHEGSIAVGGTEDEISFNIELPCGDREPIYYLYGNNKITNNENTIEKIKIEFSDIE